MEVKLFIFSKKCKFGYYEYTVITHIGYYEYTMISTIIFE